MTAKTMAEVLEDHDDDEIKGGYWFCHCGYDYGVFGGFGEAKALHQQDMLTAVGFGLVADAKAEAPRRRRRGTSRVLPPVEDQEPYAYPPEPYWGKDSRGRWQYVDYDGESLVVRFETDGDMWLDKEGQGPVYVRKEHIPVIIAALNGEAE